MDEIVGKSPAQEAKALEAQGGSDWIPMGHYGKKAVLMKIDGIAAELIAISCPGYFAYPNMQN